MRSVWTSEISSSGVISRAAIRPSMVFWTAVDSSSGRCSEKATSVAIELLPAGTVSGLKLPGSDSRWKGNSSS